jgi:hypothetical protein
VNTLCVHTVCPVSTTIIDKGSQVGNVAHTGEKGNENNLKSFG